MIMKNIAVIYGSDSSEWEVSVRSGEFTASQIDGNRFDVYEVFARFGKWTLAAYRKAGCGRVLIPEQERPQIEKADFSVMLEGVKVKFEYAYNAAWNSGRERPHAGLSRDAGSASQRL